MAQTYGRAHVGAGDEVLITAMEHHSNIVPWQLLCEEKGARLRVAPINDRGELVLEEFEKLLNSRTKIVAVTHVSNALGTINPLATIVEMAHRRDIPVLVDGAQAVPHIPVDVQALDCDFYTFSGHKVYGPTGIGVLYGKAALLEAMPPYQGGGDMISSVTFEKTTYNRLPYKFEAGTPDMAGVIGLGAAIEYLKALGIERIAAHEHELLAYATKTVSAIPGIRVIGTAKEKAGGDFVRDGRCASARYRYDSRSAGNCRAHRAPLRAAGDGALSDSCHSARFVRRLQHKRRSRRAGRGHPKSARGVCLMADLRESVSGSDSGAQQDAAEFQAAGRGRIASAEGYNPLCGDQFTVYLDMEGDAIRDIGFQGSGCAISKASASMMTQIGEGQDAGRKRRELFERFHELVTGTHGTRSGPGQAGGVFRAFRSFRCE